VLRTLVVWLTILVPRVGECAGDDSLAPVSYRGSVSVTSQLKAEVELVTGAAKRHRIDEDILPSWITKGSWESRHPNPYGTFDAGDQELFVESLVSELVHLGLFKQAVETSGDQSDDVHIRVWFVKTEYFNRGTTRYVLYVEMQIENQRGVTSKRYIADSRNALSLVKGDLYGRQLAKTAAATDLMDKLIPDIEEWLRQDESIRNTQSMSTAATQHH
jgi:hypothetical protein